MNISDDYGYNRGTLPEFIIQPSCDLTIYKDNKKIVKIVNTQDHNITGKVVFVDEYTAIHTIY